MTRPAHEGCAGRGLEDGTDDAQRVPRFNTSSSPGVAEREEEEEQEEGL